MNDKELFELAISVADERKLEAFVLRYLKSNPKAGMIALGSKPGQPEATELNTIPFNQASDPITAIKELITNAIDANVERLASDLHVDLSSYKTPSEAWAAISARMGSNPAAPDQVVMAIAKDKGDGADLPQSVVVADHGAGQKRANMPLTFLSLSGGGKSKMHWALGSFGQGSSGVHRHAGSNGYKLIVTGTGDGEWGFTILRMRTEYEDSAKGIVIEWLAADKDAFLVPGFKADSISPLRTGAGTAWSGKADYNIQGGGSGPLRPKMKHGTAVKVYSYRGMNMQGGKIEKAVDLRMDELPFPVLCIQMDASKSKNDKRRADVEGADVRVAWGGKEKLRRQTLAQCEGVPSAELLAREHHFEMTIDNSKLHEQSLIEMAREADPAKKPILQPKTFTISATAIFAPARFVQKKAAETAASADASAAAPAEKEWRKPIKDFSANRVFFSYYGQIHPTGVETIDSSRFLKDAASMPVSRDEVALFVDISNVSSRFFAKTWMVSRDKISEGDSFTALMEAVKEGVKAEREHGRLGLWEQACKDRELAYANEGVLEEQGETSFERQAKFNRMAQAHGERLKAKAALSRPMPGGAVSACEGGLEAEVGEMELKARVASAQAGASAGGPIERALEHAGKQRAPMRAACHNRKPGPHEPPSSRRSAGSTHGLAVPGAAKGARPEEAAIVEAEIQRADGTVKKLPADSHRIVSSAKEGDDACYTIAMKHGAIAEAELGEGACVVLSLRVGGRKELVHAKVVWEKIKTAAVRRIEKADESRVRVSVRLLSSDGGVVEGLQTVNKARSSLIKTQACKLVYGGTDGVDFKVTADLDVENPKIAMAVKNGKLGALVDEIKNSAGRKTCIALDQDEKELNEANLMEYLGWQGEIGGMGQWTVDSVYTASLLAMGEPLLSSTRKRKPV